MPLLPRFSKQRLSSFELWALKQHFRIRKCHPRWDSSPSMVHHIFENFDSKMVVVPSRLWLPLFHPRLSGTAVWVASLYIPFRGRWDPNGRRNANRNPEWWEDFSQLQNDGTTRVPGLTIRDCAWDCSKRAHARPQLNTIGVTGKTFFERLYLVLELRKIAPWVNCPYVPTAPTIHCTTISRFLCNSE